MEDKRQVNIVQFQQVNNLYAVYKIPKGDLLAVAHEVHYAVLTDKGDIVHFHANDLKDRIPIEETVNFIGFLLGEQEDRYISRETLGDFLKGKTKPDAKLEV